jgi:hypothetical protein
MQSPPAVPDQEEPTVQERALAILREFEHGLGNSIQHSQRGALFSGRQVDLRGGLANSATGFASRSQAFRHARPTSATISSGISYVTLAVFSPSLGLSEALLVTVGLNRLGVTCSGAPAFMACWHPQRAPAGKVRWQLRL